MRVKSYLSPRLGPSSYALSSAGPALPCLLLLAAGRSRRLGRPKGALVANGVPLLLRQLRTARAAGIDRAVVVLGAGAPRLERLLSPTVLRALNFHELRVCHASAWREGMGGSLRDGLQALPRGWQSTLILLVDQTGIQARDLRRLAASAKPGQIAATVATRTGNAMQTVAPVPTAIPMAPVISVPTAIPMAPVVLPRTQVGQALRRLHGDRGLGTWLRRLPTNAVTLVPCPAAAADLDTPADAAAWRARRQH